MRLDIRFIKQMGELLAFHKIINRPEDLTEDNYVEHVLAFQEKADIMVDGNARWDTLWQLQFPWIKQNPRLSIVKCEADVAPGSQGKDHLELRQDAAEKYNALRKEVHERGGIITTGGGLRPLSEKKRADRSVLSFHYPGLAFDLASDTGFFKPDTDPYIIYMGGNGYWEVWARSTMGETVKLNATYWDDPTSGVDKTKVVQGKFINLTEICAQHGFYPIRPRLNFTRPKDRKYIGCEWWHFQANDLLVPNFSQFGIELLRVEGITQESIMAANDELWCRKLAIFQVDWF